LIHIKRVAQEIKSVGLYDLILQDVQKIANKNRLTEDEIIEIMAQNPQILEDYKQLNVEYNLSNIHINDIDINTIDSKCRDTAQKINSNLSHLREIEKYTLDFEQSSTLVIIFSVEFFVLFSVQYFIVLLDLKEWQWWIYSLFVSSIIFAWIYANKERKIYDKNSKIFNDIYNQTLILIEELEKQDCLKKSDLLIDEADEHV
jgi:hypothetical protein